MTWIPWVLSGLSVLVALVSLVRTFIVAGSAQEEKMLGEISHIHERLGLIEMKMGLFWRLVEEHLSGMLKKPTHLEMDALLDKLKAHTLTSLDECYALRRWLQAVYLNDPVMKGRQEYLVAILVIGAVESLIKELEGSQ